MPAITVLLLLTSLFGVDVVYAQKKGLHRRENVFGWQKGRRPPFSSTGNIRRYSRIQTKSPFSALRRSENVFGWQLQPQKHRKTHISFSRRRIISSGGTTRNIINTSITRNSQNPQNVSFDNNSSSSSETHFNNFNISPPNIKIQPRKKELWLPWPLGALRNDFYRFAEEHQRDTVGYKIVNENDQGKNHRDDMRYTQQVQKSDGILNHGMDWAAQMIQSGRSLIHLPIFRGRNTDYSESNKSANPQPQPQPRYWIKDNTTSMATASAAIKKKIIGDGNGNGFDHRGGQLSQKEHANDQSWHQSMLVKYLKLQACVRLRQLSYVGSDFSIHLPPSSPALLLLYMLPSKQDPLRRMVKFTMMGATISWMHSEATKYRRFAPLPEMKKMNVRKPGLPPFLPEEWNEGGDGIKFSSEIEENETKGDDKGNSHRLSGRNEIASNLQTEQSIGQWDPFASFGGTVSSAMRSWSEDFNNGKRNKEKYRRLDVQKQLLALGRSHQSTTIPSYTTASGYALVTGASRGIGRALAVELARYGIPLILVARDMSKLKAVARDIETYYRVPCRIIQADLASPGCAKKIHAATTEAGLKVDILVNNAGICSQGEMLESKIDDAMQMIQVNVGSVVQLSQLYGRDMKQRRRGRILFVSSMSASMPGCPNVAVYAATKSFEKSLASSLGREMERFGVGVTCLLPGAVKDTAFASRSDVEDAVCFHFPGYAKTPEVVASAGIKALMLGYPEVYPGWHNRVFVKFGVPMLPARMTTLIAEYAWSPLQWGAAAPQRHGERSQSTGQNTLRNTDVSKTTSENVLPVPLSLEQTAPSNSTLRRRTIEDTSMSNGAEESSEAGSPSQSSLPKKGAPGCVEPNKIDESVSINDNKGETKFQGGGKDIWPGSDRNKLDGTRLEDDSRILDPESLPNALKMDSNGSNNFDPGSPSEENSSTELGFDIKQPPKPSNSSPLAIFGFFDRESSKSSKFPKDLCGDDGMISIESVSSPEDSDATPSSKTVKPEPSIQPDPTMEWYPMIGEKDYNFRDRRLDY